MPLRNYSLTHAFHTPVKGIPVGILPFRLIRKSRMVWLLDGEKNVEDMLIHFDKMHERDRHTNRHTRTHTHTDTT